MNEYPSVLSQNLVAVQCVLQHTVVYAVKLAINWPSALMGAITMLAVIIGCFVLFKLKQNPDTAEEKTTKEKMRWWF